MVDLALLLLRLVVGGLMIGHGAQKLFGAFGGHGLSGTTGWLAGMGLRPAGAWAFGAGMAEFGGGLLFALGLLAPLGALGIIASMTMAILLVHHPQGLWVTEGGGEYNIVLITVALAIILTGPGDYSLDALLGMNLAPLWAILAAVLILAGMLLARATRRTPAPGETE